MKRTPVFEVKRVAPGSYLVNGRYSVVRIRTTGLGGLYDTGPVWRWRDVNQVGVGSDWDTRAQALVSLRDYLGGK